jgi:hypothetical protein
MVALLNYWLLEPAESDVGYSDAVTQDNQTMVRKLTTGSPRNSGANTSFKDGSDYSNRNSVAIP